MKRRKEKQERRRRRKERRPGAGARRTERPASALGPIDLGVLHPELAHPPVYVDDSGARMPEPLACLGLDPQAPATPAAVQSAFRTALAAAPPERDSERARALLQARDFLLEPRQVLARMLGDLRVPRAEHFVPGHEPRRAPSASRAAATATDWSARARLVAILTLYALLEDEIEGGAPEAHRRTLFD